METLFAYLAGAMDSDGSFGIRRSTYAMRVRGDASQPLYSERCSLKQVTPQVPTLLQVTFGGRCATQKANTSNGRPLWAWDATDKVAAACAAALLPFLRIKARQAELQLELRRTKDDPRHQQPAFWFAAEHPDWRAMPMLTYAEVATALGYARAEMVSQAVRNGTLLALDRGTPGAPRVPAPLVEIYKQIGRRRPPQLIAWRERLWSECRDLNKIGTGEHPIYMRTGPYAPA